MLAISKKICLLGDFAVGKTSLVRRFVYDRFDDTYISTIGVKVSRKTVIIPKGDELVELTMMIWDLAGSEKFSPMRASYLRGAKGAIVIGDLTRPDTIVQIESYIDTFTEINPDSHLIIAGNKLDLINGSLPAVPQIEEIAKRINCPYYLTSAKHGIDVDDAFRHLGRYLIS